MTQIRLGIIGCCGRGQMAQEWHHPEGDSVVVATADTNPEALDWFKNNVNAHAFTTDDYRELLSRDDVDAIAVMTPDYTHEQMVCDAFEAGKHVFTEKPMAITTEGCDRMLEAWINSGKRFMVGFNMRYMNSFRVIKDAVDSGTIGEIKTVWVRHFVSQGGNWYYHDWHARSDNTTGLLLQKASHDIDMIHWITGQYTQRVAGFGGLDYYGGNKPNDLRCEECSEQRDCVEYNYDNVPHGNKRNKCVFRNEVDVEDNSTLMMQLDGGVKATYTQCHFAPDTWRNYTFIGTEGRIEDVGGALQVYTRDRSNRWKNLANQRLELKEAKGGHGGADPVVCRDFIDTLLYDTRPIATPLAGRMSVAVGCAGTYSIRHNWQPVDIQPLPQHISNNIY